MAGFHLKYNEIPKMLYDGQKFKFMNFLQKNHLVTPRFDIFKFNFQVLNDINISNELY